MNNQKRPKITVMVSVYNIAKYLPRFFESMARQTFEDYRLLIIDDGSSDNTLQICNAYAEKDARIAVYHVEHMGIAPIKNYGIKLLDTEYTVCADGDDYVEPNYLLHLITAIEKYDADWAISRVAYRAEGQEQQIIASTPARGECFIQKSDFPEMLPKLLDDRRLNYFYAKIYKTEFFKHMYIDPDVKQGGDTMLCCQYLSFIKNLVIIDDLDYNYIKFRPGSITSYNGTDSFARLLRINNYVYDRMNEMGYLNERMLFVIYKRILQSAIWVIDSVVSSSNSFRKKAEQIESILQNDRYHQVFLWMEEHNYSSDDLTFEMIPPQSGKCYLKQVQRKHRISSFKDTISTVCPKFIKEWRAKRRADRNER